MVGDETRERVVPPTPEGHVPISSPDQSVQVGLGPEVPITVPVTSADQSVHFDSVSVGMAVGVPSASVQSGVTGTGRNVSVRAIGDEVVSLPDQSIQFDQSAEAGVEPAVSFGSFNQSTQVGDSGSASS